MKSKQSIKAWSMNQVTGGVEIFSKKSHASLDLWKVPETISITSVRKEESLNLNSSLEKRGDVNSSVQRRVKSERFGTRDGVHLVSSMRMAYI